MSRFPHDQAAIRHLRKLRVPSDYFSQARSSPELWPERILCFTRKTLVGIEAEPPARHHHHRYVLMIPWQVELRWNRGWWKRIFSKVSPRSIYLGQVGKYFFASIWPPCSERCLPISPFWLGATMLNRNNLNPSFPVRAK